MFARAYQIASRFTFPVVVFRRFFDGEVQSSLATFIIVNEEGWLLTAAHVVSEIPLIQRHREAIAAHEQQAAAIAADERLTAKQKRTRVAHLVHDDHWLTHLSFLWGPGDVAVHDFKVDPVADLAAGRLEPPPTFAADDYPMFKNPQSELLCGTSLCRLGFPFHTVPATFDEREQRFVVTPGSLPAPRFPLEGIHTRDGYVTDQASGRRVRFIETSSPGLKGQSGGPIVDVQGRVWGLQSRTLHLDLGFSPEVNEGGRQVVEHQFINVGVGTHVEEIVRFLGENQIAFRMSEE